MGFIFSILKNSNIGIMTNILFFLSLNQFSHLYVWLKSALISK